MAKCDGRPILKGIQMVGPNGRVNVTRMAIFITIKVRNQTIQVNSTWPESIARRIHANSKSDLMAPSGGFGWSTFSDPLVSKLEFDSEPSSSNFYLSPTILVKLTPTAHSSRQTLELGLAWLGLLRSLWPSHQNCVSVCHILCFLGPAST